MRAGIQFAVRPTEQTTLPSIPGTHFGDLSEIAFGVLETDGKLSFVAKPQKSDTPAQP